MSEPLHWRALARVLRKRVLAELRAAPPLWKEHKRLRGSPWRDALVAIFLILFVAVALGFVIGTMQQQAFTLLRVFWLICAMAFAFTHADVLRVVLRQGRERLGHLPLSDRFLCDLALERGRAQLRVSMAFFAYLAALGALFMPLGSSPLRIVGLCLEVPVQAASVHLLSLAVLRWCPPKVSTAGGCLFLLLSLVVILPIWLAMPMGLVLDWLEVHPGALLVLPVAWAPHALEGLLAGRALDLIWALPLMAGLMAAPALLRSLRAQPWAAPPDEPEPEEDAEEDPSGEELEAVVEEVQQGVWLTGWGPEPQGWLNNAIALVLSTREQWLYRLLQPDPRWGKRIAWGLGGLAVAALLPSLFPALPPPVAAVLALFAVIGLPGIDEWSGLQAVKAEGGWIPRFVFYPIGQRELARVMLKVCAVRAMFFLVPAVALGALLAVSLGLTVLEGGSFSTRVAVGYMGLLPSLVTAQFALNLSGQRGIRCGPTVVISLWVVLVVTGAVLMLTAPGAASVRPGPGGLELMPRVEVLIGGAILWTVGWGTYWLYPFAFRRTDLIRQLSPEIAAVYEQQEKERRSKVRGGK